MDRPTDGQMYGPTDGPTDGRMDRRTDQRTDQLTDTPSYADSIDTSENDDFPTYFATLTKATDIRHDS